MASYNGELLFGRSVTIRQVQNPSAKTLTAFWGATGVYSSWGGGRGRTFFCEGVLYATSYGDLWDVIATWLSYDDGIARVLVDTVGNAWPQVVFEHFEHETPFRYMWPAFVTCSYKAVFEGRI